MWGNELHGGGLRSQNAGKIQKRYYVLKKLAFTCGSQIFVSMLPREKCVVNAVCSIHNVSLLSSCK